MTFYASDDEEAQLIATQAAPPDARSVDIAAIDPSHEGEFGRSEDDGRGVVNHEDMSWSAGQRPINLAKQSS